MRLDAGFALYSLLSRKVLALEQRREAENISLTWLRSFGNLGVAQYIFYSLLRRKDLAKDTVREAITLALSWIRNFGERPEGEYVLNSLLGRTELKGSNRTEAREVALRWLGNYPSSLSARFVLQPLLEWQHVGRTDSGLIEHALLWIGSHGRDIAAQHVLTPLLCRADLTEDQVLFTVCNALSWLETYNQEQTANFVLNALLRRGDIDERSERRASALALEWLKDFPHLPNRDHVLNSLLRSPCIGDPEVRAYLFSEALRWLSENPNELQPAAFMLSNLWEAQETFREDRLRDAIQEIARSRGIDLGRIESRKHARWPWMLLRRIGQLSPGSPDRQELLLRAVDLFSSPEFMGLKAWSYVFESLLAAQDLPPLERRKIIEIALMWVCESWEKENFYWVYIFENLLACPDVEGQSRKTLLSVGLAWLMDQANFQNKGWRHICDSLLQCLDLEHGERERLLGGIFSWLTQEGEEQRDHWDAVLLRVLNWPFLEATWVPGFMALGESWQKASRDHQKRSDFIDALQAMLEPHDSAESTEAE
jgi:hypothetical protein